MSDIMKIRTLDHLKAKLKVIENDFQQRFVGMWRRIEEYEEQERARVKKPKLYDPCPKCRTPMDGVICGYCALHVHNPQPHTERFVKWEYSVVPPEHPWSSVSGFARRKVGEVVVEGPTTIAGINRRSCDYWTVKWPDGTVNEIRDWLYQTLKAQGAFGEEMT